MKKGNIIFGIIGAVIGSLSGMLLYAGLTLIRIFSSWSGMLSAFFSVYLYKKFNGGKLGKIGAFICGIISCLSMFFAEIIATSYSISKTYKYPFWDILSDFDDIYPNLSNKFVFWLYPTVACIFVVIVIVGLLSEENKAKNVIESNELLMESENVASFDDEYNEDEELEDEEDFDEEV